MKLFKRPKDGKVITLLNPHEKAQKARYENIKGYKITNAGEIKCDKSGNPVLFTNTEKAFRSGYAQCERDMAKAYAPKNNGNSKKYAAKYPTEREYKRDPQMAMYKEHQKILRDIGQ
jgi:hypothetical protein